MEDIETMKKQIADLTASVFVLQGEVEKLKQNMVDDSVVTLGMNEFYRDYTKEMLKKEGN